MALPVGALCIDHFDGIEVKITDASVGRRGHLVAQSQVEGKVGCGMKVILDEFRQIPVSCGVSSLQEILERGAGHTQQQRSEPIPSIQGGDVATKGAVKGKDSMRRRHLEKVALLPAEVDAELQRVPTLYPGESSGVFFGGRIFEAASHENAHRRVRHSETRKLLDGAL